MSPTAQLKTPICDLLGCEFPILQAGMGGVARSDLAAAVSAAGAFGCLGMVRETPNFISQQIRAVRKLTQRNFGINIIPAATDDRLLRHQIATIIDEHISTVVLFWDVHVPTVRQLRDAGITILHQVGTVDAAKEAADAGANAIIAQGFEAGGHVHGRTSTLALVPKIVDVVDIPVIASGGIADGRGLVAAMALGAQGIHCGTAFLATEESFAHDYHKQKVESGRSEQTVHTEIFHINWPEHSPTRVLQSPITDSQGIFHRDNSADKPPDAIVAYEGERPIRLYSTDSPLRSTHGELAYMPLYAGQSVGMVNDVVPAKARIRQIVDVALKTLNSLAQPTYKPKISYRKSLEARIHHEERVQ